MIRFGVLTLLLALSLVPDATGSQASEDQRLPLVLLVATDRPTYQAGSTVTMTVAVDNPGPTDVTATFSSGQVYDLVVSQGQREVWRASAGQGFTQALVDRSFPPGLTMLGRTTWEWRAEDGSTVPAGAYRLEGRLATIPPQTGNVLELVLVGP